MKGTIFITGASSGIGRALAFEFSKRGYSLGLFARRFQLLQSLKDELSNDNPVAIAKLDISQSGSIPKVFEKLAKELGDVLSILNLQMVFIQMLLMLKEQKNLVI